MDTVFIRLCGPMQSWGLAGRFDVKDSAPWPTKSGVVGLVASALGINRFGNIDHLVSLRLAVAVLREGTMNVDYHTATMSARSGPKHSDKTAQTWRAYISDGDFVASLTGDSSTIQAIKSAIRDPAWIPFLGRRSYAPSTPLLVDIEGANSGDLRIDMIDAVTQVLAQQGVHGAQRITFAIECGEETATATLPDQPIGRFADRRFARRAIRTSVEEFHIGTDLLEEGL